MKRMKQKLSLVLILSMLVSMFGGIVSASAAVTKSSWSFRTGSGKRIEVNETLAMKKNEFQDFNLYKSGVQITENDSRYSVAWSSSDSDVLWINPKTGKSRADRSKTMTSEYGEATITAKIRNKVTGAVAYRRFKVTVGVKPPELTEVKFTFEDSVDLSKPLELGQSYKYITEFYDQNGEVFDVSTNETYYLIFFDTEALEVDVDEETLTPIKAGEHTATIAIFDNIDDANEAETPEDSKITKELSFIVEDNTPKITAIHQTELTKVELTFNKEDYAKDVVLNNQKLKMSYLLNGREVQSTYQMLSVKEDDPKTVCVSLFSSLSEGIEYLFRYTNGDQQLEAKIVGSGVTPSYIKLIPEEVEIETDYKLQVKVYNAAHVDITSVIKYPVYFEALDNRYEYDYILSDNTLFFLTTGVTAKVKATMDMPYDSMGNQMEDLYDIASFTSVPKTEPIYFDCDAYSITEIDGTAKPEKLTYQSVPKTICADDQDLYLSASFTYYDTKHVESKQYIVSGADTLGTSGYTYLSTNESYLLVDRYTGELYPLRKGNAAVQILNPKGETVGVVNIKISDNRALSTFAAVVQGTQTMSATGDTSGIEKLVFNLKTLDQNGEPMKNVAYTYQIIYPENSAPFETVFNHSLDNNVLKIWENTGLATEVEPGSIRAFNVQISAIYGSSKMTSVIRVVVKNTVAATAAKTELSVSQERIDLKLDKGSLEDYESEIQVRTYDSSGYLIKLEDIKQIYSTAEASTKLNEYSVLIQRNGEAVTKEEFTLENKTLTLKPVVLSGDVVSKAPAGVYEIKLYKGTGAKAQLISAKNIVLTDTPMPIVVTQKDKYASGTDLINLKEYFQYTLNGKDITEYVSPYKHTFIQVNTLCHVSEINARVYLRGLSELWPETYYTLVDIKTAVQFTIQ